MRIPSVHAPILVVRAEQVVSRHKSCRFGQALWNLIHQDYPDLAEEHLGKDTDFFYSDDRVAVVMAFYEHYVENFKYDAGTN